MKKTAGIAKRQPMDLPLAQVPVGRVHVIADRCKECSFCIEFCPTDVLAYSEDINAKGYHYPLVVEGKETSCIHCRFCDLICPELAIYTTETAAAKNAEDAEDAKGKPDAG